MAGRRKRRKAVILVTHRNTLTTHSPDGRTDYHGVVIADGHASCVPRILAQVYVARVYRRATFRRVVE